MKRTKIVAGNWKMNMNFDEGRDLTISIIRQLGPTEHKVILCPPYIHLNYLSVLTKGIANLHIGCQNCHPEPKGAYTGEISVPMLKSVGVKYVIVGHSERREYFGENEGLLAKKVNSVLENGLKVIFCCGEKLETREASKQEEIVKSQIQGAIFHLTKEQFQNIIIAYEPVWAIGTGKTATSSQAQEMHAFIRKIVADKYGDDTAQSTSILYGGSCKPGNAKELFSNPDVDGGLIGGASLKAEDFVAITNSFPER